VATLEIRPGTSPFNDGTVLSSDAAWATVLAGYSAGFVNTSGTVHQAGTEFNGSVYRAGQIFLRMDLSDPVLTGATINSATLEMRKSSGAASGFVIEARIFDPDTGVTTADYRTSAQFAALTLGATLDVSGSLSNGVYSFASASGLASAVQSAIGGFIGFAVCNDLFAAGTTPTTNRSINFSSANDATAANRPALIIDYTPASAIAIPVFDHHYRTMRAA
jgi:hypothetical protein